MPVCMSVRREIAEHRKRGLTYAEIATKYGITRKQAYHYANYRKPRQKQRSTLQMRIINALYDGASTSRDVANMLNMDIRLASATLSQLAMRGDIVCVGKEYNSANPAKVYRLADGIE